MTIVWTRTGTTAPPMILCSIVTWVFESGRIHFSSPDFRSSAILENVRGRFGVKNYLDVQLVGEHKSERHLLFSFVGSVSEHESLITSADVFVGAVLVDSLSDVRRLLLKTVLDSAREVVQPFFVRIVSDSLEKNKI